MALQAPLPGKPLAERILVMGGFSTGKTTTWLNIAKWLHETGSPAKVYVIDTDMAAARMMSGANYSHLPNVEVRDAYEWGEYISAVEHFSKVATMGDWIVCDFVSTAWEAVQAWFVDEYFAADIADFFAEARANRAGGNPLDGWKDWSVINKQYKKFSDLLFKKNQAHILVTAPSRAIQDKDAPEIRATFASYGHRPEGQKHLGHLPHTILHAQAIRPGEVYFTTVKDRERRPLEAQRINEFAIDYLVQVAGWQL